MRFLHLTDTHYINDNQLPNLPEGLQDVFNKQESFDNKLEIIKKNEELEQYDFVVVSGDLVHENDENNYRELFAKLKNTFSSLPVFYTLGNHDINSEFHKANGKGYSGNDAYDYSINFEGYHLIFIDSSKSGDSLGSFTSNQIQWLEEELSINELPKLVFVHHPLFGGEDYQKYAIVDNETVLNTLQNHSILGIFTGHTHQPAVHVWNGIPQFTSYCFGFGTNHVNSNQVLDINDMTGYTTVEVNGTVAVQPRLIKPLTESLYKIQRSNIETLQQA